jgi:hypothetical protein
VIRVHDKKGKGKAPQTKKRKEEQEQEQEGGQDEKGSDNIVEGDTDPEVDSKEESEEECVSYYLHKI